MSDTGLTHIYTGQSHTGFALWPAELDKGAVGSGSYCSFQPRVFSAAREFYDACRVLPSWVKERLRGLPLGLEQLKVAAKELVFSRVAPSGSVQRCERAGWPTASERMNFEQIREQTGAVWVCAEFHDLQKAAIVAYAQPYEPCSGRLFCVNCFGYLAVGRALVISRQHPMPECARYLHSLEGFSGKWELHHHAKSDLFCGGACRAVYQLKRSSTRLRRKLHKAERGICRSCGVDCDHVWLRLRLAAHPEERWNVLVEEMSLSMEHAKKSLVGECTGTIKKLCNEPTEGALWQCDHIYEVRHGGGEASDLSQVQTLCVFCHLVKTHNPTASFVRDV